MTDSLQQVECPRACPSAAISAAWDLYNILAAGVPLWLPDDADKKQFPQG